MDESLSTEIVKSSRSELRESEIKENEVMISSFLAALGLPTTKIFADTEERIIVGRNLETAIRRLSIEARAESKYISKFILAVVNGLFDAALNYLWDETVSKLRERIQEYDLTYFYDNAIKSDRRRSEFSSAQDLAKLIDQELIDGSLGIELITEAG